MGAKGKKEMGLVEQCKRIGGSIVQCVFVSMHWCFKSDAGSCRKPLVEHSNDLVKLGTAAFCKVEMICRGRLARIQLQSSNDKRLNKHLVSANELLPVIGSLQARCLMTGRLW